MFNEIRLYEDQPVRLWARDPRVNKRYVIFPDGLMKLVDEDVLANLPRPIGAVNVFPVQDPRPAHLM